MNAIANPPVSFAPPRSVVMIGMPGSGKSSVGRKLAATLAIPFVDADSEIEAAAGMSIERIFEQFGEAEFRKGERRVIARLLDGPLQVLATGGGAFMDAETRALVRAKGVSVWLKTDLALLAERTARRNDRPLLKGDDPPAILEKLLTQREPFYAEADVTVASDGRPTEETVGRVLTALQEWGSGSGATGAEKERRK
ncbi:MAG TPA: shikimate kinase [Alphaproteobacteria bacterium]|nr:shikimate kinase [Alphaproteobacteria bacterium]